MKFLSRLLVCAGALALVSPAAALPPSTSPPPDAGSLSGTLSPQRLPASGVTPGTYGDAAHTVSPVVDQYGRITALTQQLIAIGAGQVSGLAASATTDTTNAGNISSGTVPFARLPAPGTVAGTLAAGNDPRITGAVQQGGAIDTNTVGGAALSTKLSTNLPASVTGPRVGQGAGGLDRAATSADIGTLLPFGTSIAPTLQSFGGVASTSTASCNTTIGSSTLTGCGTPNDFANSNGILIDHVGAAPLANTPTGVTVTPCGQPSSPLFQCATGNVTLYYALVPVDVGHGYGTPSAPIGTTTASTPTMGTSNYVWLTWTNPTSNAPTAYCVYAGPSPTSMVYTDLIPGYNTSWGDYGHGPIPADFCPAALPTGPANDALIAHVYSGGGTATIGLDNNAGVSSSSAVVQHDNIFAIRNAAATGQLVSLPCGTYMLSEAAYNVNMFPGSGFIGAAAGCSRFQMTSGLASQPAFYAAGAGIVMKDVSLDSGGFWSSYEPLFQCASCIAPKFLNLTIPRMSKFGVTVDSGSSDALFDNPDITAPVPMVEPQNAIVVSGAPRTIIRNPKIRGTLIGTVSDAIQIVGGSIKGFISGAGVTFLENPLGPINSGCSVIGTEISSGAPAGWLDVSHTTPSGIEGYCASSHLDIYAHDNPGYAISSDGPHSKVAYRGANNLLGGIVFVNSDATYNSNGSLADESDSPQAFNPISITTAPGGGAPLHQITIGANNVFGATAPIPGLDGSETNYMMQPVRIALSAENTTTTSTSTSNIIAVASSAGVTAGQVVIGPGIPAGTSVTYVNGTLLLLSGNVNVASGAALTFSGQVIPLGASPITFTQPGTVASAAFILPFLKTDATITLYNEGGAVSGVTFNATVNGGPTSFATNTPYSLHWDNTAGAWFRVQ